jgi:16S rRNA (cytosine967-C5)-methyltransferase
MSRYYSYLNSAKDILVLFNGKEALPGVLKKYFSGNKKFGSRDRKQISHLCYCYFRLGKMAIGLSTTERILLGLFLCSDKPNEILEALKPEWNEKAALGIEEKCSIQNEQYSIFNVFPWKEELSNGIDHQRFSESFFMQPDLFLRLRPGKEELVKQKLDKAGIVFSVLPDSCLALPNSSKIDEIIALNKEAVVQDHSSQRVGEFIQIFRRGPSDHLQVWDCCAASGGKSIMAKDILGNIDLTVSDIRESILVNLRKRFKEAGLTNYKSKVADLADPSLNIPHSVFDIIIADVPCSGSGTWSRTPEQLYYFEPTKIDEYAKLQRDILKNIVTALKPGGFLLYITCSVFRKENEDIVNLLQEKMEFELVKMELLKGYTIKADTMFAALLQKPL